MRILAFYFVCLLWLGAEMLQPSYAIKRDSITSSDLFPQAPHFAIASFGDRFELEIARDHLEELFRSHGFPLAPSSYAQIKFVFSPPFEVQIAQEEIRQAFLQYFASFSPKIEKISLKPLGDIEGKKIKILGANIQEKAFKKNRFSLSLEIEVDGRRSVLPFLCEIEASLEVYVALSGIQANQELNPQNVAKKRIAFESSATPFAKEDQIYASSSRGFIAKDSVIFASKIKPQILIKRGEWIEVSHQEGSIAIQTKLQAMQNASLGQEINAKNPQTQKTIRVKVTARGKGVAL